MLPQQNPNPNGSSQHDPLSNQLPFQHRYYSPQSHQVHQTSPNSENNQEDNEEIYEASNDTVIYMSSDEEEYAKNYQVRLTYEDRPRNPRNDHSPGDREKVRTFQLTRAVHKLDQKEEQKEVKEIGCQCLLHEHILGRKKSGNGVQLEEDTKILKGGKWTKTKCILNRSRLAFIEISFEVQQISKIKIFELGKDTHEQTIKIQVGDTSHFFSLDSRKKVHDLPLPFFMYASLIMRKIQKLELQAQTDWQKEPHLDGNVTADSYIFGKIFKKSQHLGIWGERYVVVKKEGILSYRDGESVGGHTFEIKKESVKYIWTRLELLQKWLIVKIKWGVHQTQFAIPISQYSCRGCNNWLFCLYRMLCP